MFKKIIDAIKLLFSSIFGGGKKTPTKIETEALTNAPQDAAEIKPDTIVMVSNEMESVIIPPDDKGPEFDADLFEEVTDPIVEIVPEPVPAVPDPEPEPEPDPVPVTDSEPTPATTHTPRYLWCLDNGHGSKTPGKRSPVFDDGETQFFEYEFNRNIVARIIKQLEVIGVKYFNVVPEVDTDNFLEGRVNRANNKNQTFQKFSCLCIPMRPLQPAALHGRQTTSAVLKPGFSTIVKKDKKSRVFFKSTSLKKRDFKTGI